MSIILRSWRFIVASALVLGACAAVDLTDPAELVVGDCFNAEEAEDRVPGVEIRVCDELHQYELFAVSTIAAGGGYPAEAEFRAAAQEACVPRLELYADVWAADRLFDFGFFYPTEEEWNAGRRRLACYLYDYGGSELERSVRVLPPPDRVAHGDLVSGDCFDAPPTDVVYTVLTRDCREPHDFEVFAGFELEADGDAAYPGVGEVEQAVVDACLPGLDSYAPGLRSAESITYSFYRPSTEAWEAGERRIVCFVHATSGKIEGSVTGRFRIVTDA